MRASLMPFLTGAVTLGARWLMAAQRANAALPTLFEKRALTLSIKLCSNVSYHNRCK